MDPLERSDDLAELTDDQLRTLAASLEHRCPPARVPSVGVRPDRRPWTYRDIWLLDAVREELARRGAA
ncbi:MAG: hypothetical protein ACC726_06380 [Chloroflexota bacterium]